MKDFFIGFILAIVMLTMAYQLFLKPQPITIIQTVVEVDTVYVSTVDTLTIIKQKIVPKIIYVDGELEQYIAIFDTLIVKPRVEANLQTKFYHPQKLFDIDYQFKVKVDSVYIHTIQIITKTNYVEASPYRIMSEIYYLERQNDKNLGIGVTFFPFDRYGITAKFQTDKSFGIGLSIRY